MPNITVRRYADTSHGWLASIEPDDGSWVVFVHTDGTATLFDPSTDKASSTAKP